MKNNDYGKIDVTLTRRRKSAHAPCTGVHAFPTEATESITVEKIEDIAKLELLRASWNDLLSDSEADNLFLTWEWLHTWWKHLSERHKLHVLTVRRASRLIAVAPFVVNPAQTKRLLPFRSIEFMGMSTVGTDYLDIIIRHGEEKVALDTLLPYFSDHRLLVELRRVKAGVTATSRLVSGLTERGWRIDSSVTETCPYIRLQGHSRESYLASLGSSHRQNVRRCLRRIDKDFSSELVQVRTDEERRECLKIFESLHHKRWDTQPGTSSLNNDATMTFHEEFSRLALQNGWLRLFVLRLNGRPAACIYGFRYGDVFYFYQSGFDPGFKRYSVGLVTMALSIRSAIEEGVHMYDMLHGVECYKFLWAHEKQDLLLLRCYPPSMKGALSRHAYLFRNGIKALYYRIARGGSSAIDDGRRFRTDSL